MQKRDCPARRRRVPRRVPHQEELAEIIKDIRSAGVLDEIEDYYDEIDWWDDDQQDNC